MSIEHTPTKENIRDWTHQTVPFFSSLPSFLCVKDDEGHEWCVLHYSHEIKNKEYGYSDNSIGMKKGSQCIWLIADAFFVNESDFRHLNECFLSPQCDVEDLPSPIEVYQLYNREYAWSQGSSVMHKDSWSVYELKSDNYSLETVMYNIPDFEHITRSEDGSVSIPYVMKEFQKKVPVNSKFINLASACSYYLWEEEYDASQEDSTGYYVPCYDLIQSMNLKQREQDGFFYAPTNELVCFDNRLMGGDNRFLIRMDYLQEFLKKNGLQLCWKCVGEKQYFLKNSEQIWSRWQGFAFDSEGTIQGDMTMVEKQY